MDVARKRLRKYPNVEFKLGDIAALDLPDGGYDVVFVHFVLHDIDAAERPRIVQHLAHKLKRDGRLFVREPLRFIAPDEILRLMRQSGLAESAFGVTNIKTQGEVCEGVFVPLQFQSIR
jgi:ubiquinone/menaquinone biosynthesis C-methylase UbiE